MIALRTLKFMGSILKSSTCKLVYGTSKAGTEIAWGRVILWIAFSSIHDDTAKLILGMFHVISFSLVCKLLVMHGHGLHNTGREGKEL